MLVLNKKKFQEITIFVLLTYLYSKVHSNKLLSTSTSRKVNIRFSSNSVFWTKSSNDTISKSSGWKPSNLNINLIIKENVWRTTWNSDHHTILSSFSSKPQYFFGRNLTNICRDLSETNCLVRDQRDFLISFSKMIY